MQAQEGRVKRFHPEKDLNHWTSSVWWPSVSVLKNVKTAVCTLNRDVRRRFLFCKSSWQEQCWDIASSAGLSLKRWAQSWPKTEGACSGHGSQSFGSHGPVCILGLQSPGWIVEQLYGGCIEAHLQRTRLAAGGVSVGCANKHFGTDAAGVVLGRWSSLFTTTVKICCR